MVYVRITTYAYDTNGFQKSITDPLMHISSKNIQSVW